jgi:phosphoglycerol geranylgeranyltransferase
LRTESYFKRMDLLGELLKKQKKLHYTLIDPENQTPLEAGKRAGICAGYGTDAIMIGGSTVRDTKLVYDTVAEIKKAANLPTILFPNSAESMSGNADYVFYMMLMNSLDRRFILSEQIKGAPLIKRWGIKPVSMGYILISVSEKPTTVERVASLDRITENDVLKAIEYALAAQYYNMECVYLEAGSGAEKPVPDEIISAVRENIDIPIIVGGGIRDAKTARQKADAGADAIVNGTATEKDPAKLKSIIQALKQK